MLNTVGSNTFKSLARSHPLVFNKHHNDLQLLPNGQVIAIKKDDDEEEEVKKKEGGRPDD